MTAAWLCAPRCVHVCVASDHTCAFARASFSVAAPSPFPPGDRGGRMGRVRCGGAQARELPPGEAGRGVLTPSTQRACKHAWRRAIHRRATRTLPQGEESRG